MPPNNDHTFEPTLPPEEVAVIDAVDTQETAGEAMPTSDTVSTFEAVEQNPQTVGESAIAEIGEHAETVSAEAVDLQAEIPLSLGSTESEVVQAAEETGLMAKLRGIGEQVSDIAGEAKAKIGELVSGVSGRVLRVADTTAAAAIIATAGSFPHTEAPEVPEHGAVATETFSQTEEAKEEEARFAVAQERKRWHEANGGEASVNILRDYFSQTLRKTVDPEKTIDNDTVARALEDVKGMIEGYPKELRKDILDDSRFTDAMSRLNLMRLIAHRVPVSDTPIDHEQMALARNIGKAMEISHNAIEDMHGDLLQSAKSKLETGDPYAALQVARLYDGHIRNAAILAEGTDDPAYLQSIPKIADETFGVLAKFLKEDARGKDSYYIAGQSQLLEFLAQAGHKEGVALLAEKVKRGEVGVDELSGVFADIQRANIPQTKKIYEDPNYAGIGRGGEAFSNALLSAYGLNPDRYAPYWKSETNNQEATNRQIGYNSRALVRLEEKVPGGMNTLTKRAGILHPGRYSTELLEEQLRAKPNPKLKYGGTISAIDDDNGAFAGSGTIDNLYQQAKAAGISLRVAEAGSRYEVSKRLLDMVAQNGRRMSFLGIRGHGTKDTTAMGRGADGKIDSEFLGVSRDPENPDRSSLILDESAPIYFESCSTGKEGGIAEGVSAKTSPGRKVIAPDNDTNIERLTLSGTREGKVSFEIKYRDFGKPVATKTYVGGREVDERGNIKKVSTADLLKN